MANVDVSTDVVIERPRALVAQYATDPDNAPRWYANIDSVRWLTKPPLAPGSRVAFRARFLGRRLDYIYEFVEYAPEQALVMRTDAGPFPMETTYTWADTDAGHTRMTLRNRGYPSGFGSLAAPALAAAMRRANVKDLATLKTIIESAQT